MPAHVPIGSHVPVAGGLVKGGFAYGRDTGAEALQIFVGNPRGWALAAGNPQQDKAFRELCETHDIPVYVHTPYLVNLGSPTAATFERSVASVRHNVLRGRAIGARGVLVHTGSCVADAAYDKALRQIRAGLLPLLDELDDGDPYLLLEPTAGQGRSLCAGIDDLPPYLAALDWHPRLGICLDTCHVFAAGAPLDEPDGAVATVDRLIGLVGSERLRLVHGNDAKDARGSFRDRHERVGRGRIGLDAFAALLKHPAVAGIPVILETPGDKAAHTEDIALLKGLR